MYTYITYYIWPIDCLLIAYAQDTGQAHCGGSRGSPGMGWGYWRYDTGYLFGKLCFSDILGYLGINLDFGVFGWETTPFFRNVRDNQK